MIKNNLVIGSIYNSDLCVSDDTLLLTKEHGEVPIANYKDKKVSVWNGFEWSEVTVKQTSNVKEMLTVYLESHDKPLVCTPYHTWYIKDSKGCGQEVKTVDLQPGNELIGYILPDNLTHVISHKVKEVKNEGHIGPTYCVSEPKRKKVIFNGILTGNCSDLETKEVTGVICE